MSQPSTLYKISKAAELLGVSKDILRRWDNEGKIKAIRTPGGMRLYDITDINPASFTKQKAKSSKTVVLYARVSSAKQRDDLERQQKYLTDHIPNEYSRHETLKIADIGSGINFKRKGLLSVLGRVKEGNVSAIVVASRDRMARFGFELIEWMCEQFGTKVVVLEDEDTTPEEELGKDLMSIVQVYCCRWNGRRRYRAKKQQGNNNKNDEVKAEIDPSTETDVE
jgi:putative resolvase